MTTRGSESERGPRAGFVSRTLGVGPGEVRLALLGALCSWFVMASYYMLKPVRDEIGAAGARNLEWMFWGTFAGTLIASPVFAVLASRLRRGVFMGLAFRFLGVNLLGFGAAFLVLDGSALTWAEYVFFAWISVFIMFVGSLVWSLMADVASAAGGKRAFGIVAAGSSLGGLAGSAVTASLAADVDRAVFLGAGLALLEGAAWVARAIDRRLPGRPTPVRDALDEVEGRGALTLGGAVAQLGAGAVLITRSPYLLLVCAYLLFHTFAGTAVYFQQADIVGELLETRAKRTSYLATIDMWTNALSLYVQFLIVGRIMSRLGTWVPLLLLPLVSGVVLVSLGWGQAEGLGASSLLVLLALLQVARRSSNYALAKPARETLFTVVSRGEKYKAKNFIDTVVYRGGDAVSGSAYEALSGAMPMGVLSQVLAPLMLVWGGLGLVLARLQGRRARGLPEEPATGPALAS